MSRPDFRHAAACLLACSALLACGGGEPSDGGVSSPCDLAGGSGFSGSGYGAIGPAGGVVEATDPTSPVAGVRVEVAPGAWDECWEVRIGYAWIFDTPDYPKGFVPFERPGPSGSVEIQIGLSTSSGFYRAPDPLPIQLSFPMGRIALEPLDVRAAYFYDDAQGSWRVVLPQALTPDRMTVETTAHDELWSWGRLAMGEVDFERYVSPAMEASYGSDTLSAIRAAIDKIRSDAAARRFQLTCLGLWAAEDFVGGVKQAAADRVQEIQAGFGCGECNPLTEKFEEELQLYADLKIGWEVVSGVTDLLFPPKRAYELALIPLQEYAEDWMVDKALGLLNQSCDFGCYFEQDLLPLRLNVAVYYGCDWVREAIELYATAYVGCKPHLVQADPGWAAPE